MFVHTPLPCTSQTNPDTGLSGAMVEERFACFGFNEVPVRERWIQRLAVLSHVWEPISVAIWCAAMVELIKACFTGEGLAELVVLLFLQLMTGFVGYVENAKASKAKAVLKQLLPKECSVCRNGKYVHEAHGRAVLVLGNEARGGFRRSPRRLIPVQVRTSRPGCTAIQCDSLGVHCCALGRWSRIPVRNLVPGDLIELKRGDIVPADAILLPDVQRRQARVQISSALAWLTGDCPSNHNVSSSGRIRQGGTVEIGESKAVVCATGATFRVIIVSRLLSLRRAPAAPCCCRPG